MKFLIPYGDNLLNDPYKFREELLKRIDHIAGVYMGWISVSLFRQIPEMSEDSYEYRKFKLIYEFLNVIQDLPIEKFLVFNAPDLRLDIERVNNLFGQMSVFGNLITGASFSNLYLAKMFAEHFPNKKVDMSVYSAVYHPSALMYWRREVPTLYSINPPRDVLRTPESIAGYRRYGVKIKAIINETCLYSCPFGRECINLQDRTYCEVRGHISDILRGIWVSPSRLKELDVDIAKIVHRDLGMKRIFNILDHYIAGDDNVDLFEMINGPQTHNFMYGGSRRVKINMAKIPKKIYTCKCSECYPVGKCQVCEKFTTKVINDHFREGKIDKEEYNYFMERI